MDEVVAYTQTVGGVTTRYYPHYNHLYSVAALTDGTTGAVVERYTYDAYGKQKITDASGNVTRAKSSVGWDRGFTGYITDNETGLLHARARQYSPTLGRFVGRDPFVMSLLPLLRRKFVMVDGLNLYQAYFIPNYTDRTGWYKDPKKGDYCKVGDNCTVGDGSYDEDTECCENGKVVKKKRDDLATLCCPSEMITDTFKKSDFRLPDLPSLEPGTVKAWCENRFKGKCLALCMSAIMSSVRTKNYYQVTLGPTTINCCSGNNQ